MIDHVALKEKCFKVLLDNVGDVEMEWFIHDIQTQKQDYTKWRRDHYDSIADNNFDAAVRKHSNEHPFTYKKAVEI